MSSPTMVRAPKAGIPFRLYVTAEDNVIGAMLTQEVDGKEYIITFLSRHLLDAETRGCEACQRFGNIQLLSNHGRFEVGPCTSSTNLSFLIKRASVCVDGYKLIHQVDRGRASQEHDT
ncbi:hypothetical protein GUJ93_ZPchr0013g35373 [Zizania palustris]|uniref:Reverse transcriptase/retrotransposon-derived protein RNase H-like domain-containing protein n=1 Tax=Zizania palustris TaxID=103762 RepID=A0A8J5WYI6_ZIZPA|nr:hypothetical protein GUJ93_ZPchr0013g35373 [Zizania palustris]